MYKDYIIIYKSEFRFDTSLKRILLFRFRLTFFYTRILFNRYYLWIYTFVIERVCENPLTNIFWMDRNFTIARFHPNNTYILMDGSRKEACRVISLHPTAYYNGKIVDNISMIILSLP